GRIEAHENLVRGVSPTFEGLSLSSGRMIVALGLAITFGVMGVINMAHGEMLMIGAYATYTVQLVFQSVFPNHYDLYFWVAIPASFVAAAAVGLAMERLLLRFLYGRPLESLLATWGISLILQQAVRRSEEHTSELQSPDHLVC